jgi:hypothetical protein
VKRLFPFVSVLSSNDSAESAGSKTPFRESRKRLHINHLCGVQNVRFKERHPNRIPSLLLVDQSASRGPNARLAAQD